MRPRGARDRVGAVDPGRSRTTRRTHPSGPPSSTDGSTSTAPTCCRSSRCGTTSASGSGSCRAIGSGACAATSTCNYLRVREWRDLYSQLRQVAGQLDIRPTVDDAHPDLVHRAVLAGLLSHIGTYATVTDGSTAAARDARFVIAPGSVLSKRGPKWVMAAELVETNRLWARRVATIQPEWAESLAPHLVKRSYGDPWWDAPAGPRGRRRDGDAVRAADRERRGRSASAGSIRRWHVRCSSGTHWWPATGDTRTTSWRPTPDSSSGSALLEARVRRIDLLDDEAVFEFYDERVGDDVTSGRDFDRWWKSARRDDPNRLDLEPVGAPEPARDHARRLSGHLAIDGAEYR